MSKPMQHYIIQPHDQQQGWRMSRMAVDGLRNAAIKARDSGQPMEVYIQPFTPARSDPQRKTLWMWHGEVAADLSVRKQVRWTKVDVHELIFTSQFMPVSDKPLVMPETDMAVRRRRRTSEVSQAEITEAMDAYLTWIYNMGIEVTIPETGW